MVLITRFLEVARWLVDPSARSKKDIVVALRASAVDHSVVGTHFNSPFLKYKISCGTPVNENLFGCSEATYFVGSDVAV